MALGDQPPRQPTKGAAHYRHAKAAQQRGDDVTDVKEKRRRLLEAHRAKMMAKRGESPAALEEASASAEADEQG